MPVLFMKVKRQMRNDKAFLCAAREIDILESELSNFDDISITETWFIPNKTSSNINLNGFGTPLDRTGDGHGGVAVYVKMKYHAKGATTCKL